MFTIQKRFMKNKNAEVVEVYLNELETLFKKSKNEQNPAYWLYTNKARTPLFMLESITRIFAKTTNDPFAKTWNKFFKKLEDAIGEIDYYDALIKEFKPKRSVKKEQIEYFTKKRDKTLTKLNEKLINRNFYTSFLLQFRKGNIMNFSDKTLLKNIHNQIKTEILLTEEAFMDHINGFKDFEEGVHTMRRKLRWISIYGISLGGIVILKKNRKNYEWEKEFITKTELNSKYNKLPVKKGLNYYIPFNEKAFLALSHVIDQLGIIKDKGLSIEALAKWREKTGAAIKPNNPVNTSVAGELKIKEALLKQAHELVYKFFITYKIHNELLKA